MNTLVVTLVRYSGLFLKWIRKELKQMHQRTRKQMTMHKTLHHRDEVERLYESRKKGGRGLASIEDESVKKKLMTAIRNNTYNTKINRTKITRKQKWEENQHY